MSQEEINVNLPAAEFVQAIRAKPSRDYTVASQSARPFVHGVLLTDAEFAKLVELADRGSLFSVVKR